MGAMIGGSTAILPPGVCGAGTGSPGAQTAASSPNHPNAGPRPTSARISLPRWEPAGTGPGRSPEPATSPACVPNADDDGGPSTPFSLWDELSFDSLAASDHVESSLHLGEWNAVCDEGVAVQESRRQYPDSAVEGVL